MKSKENKKICFSRGMIPKKKEQEESLFTLKPRLKKTLTLRKRKPRLAFLQFIKAVEGQHEILSKLRKTDH